MQTLIHFVIDQTTTHRLAFAGSCAVVGNAGHLRQSSLGAHIDAHDFVLRFNDAPTGSFPVDCLTCTHRLSHMHALTHAHILVHTALSHDHAHAHYSLEHSHTHARTRIRTRTHAHTFIHSRTHTHLHTHAGTHIHTRISAHTAVLFSHSRTYICTHWSFAYAI